MDAGVLRIPGGARQPPRHGIGKELVRRTQAELGPNATIILLAAPAAVDFYLRISMEKHNSAWILRPGRDLRD